jgi:hypothetical protein
MGGGILLTNRKQEFERQEILRLPEWYQPMYNGEGSCPWCENFKHEGHHPDCKRKVVVEILKAALDG